MARSLVIRIFAVLLVLCLLAVSAVFIWFYSLDGAYRRQYLSDLVTEYTGAQLKIEGDVSISFWGRPGLEISEITLTFADQLHRLQANQLALRLSYSSILTGEPIFAHIGIQDAVIALDLQQYDTTSDAPADPPSQVASLPPVHSLVIKRTQLQLLGLKPSLDLWFEEARVSNLQRFSPVILEAEFDLITDQLRESVDLRLTLEGQPVSERSNPLLSPMKFNLAARTEQIQLSGQGSLQRPARLSGLSAKVQLEAELDRYLKLLTDQELPPDLRMQLETSVSGDLVSLNIDELVATVSAEDKLSVHFAGKQIPLADPLSASLELSARISDQPLLASLLPDNYPTPERLTVAGQVSPGADALRAEDLDIVLDAKNSLSLFIKGETSIGYQSPRFRGTDLALSFVADNTRAAEVLLFPGIPELGAAKGSGKLYEQGDDLRVEDVKINLGDHSLGGRISGNIQRMPLDPRPNRGMDFDFEVYSRSTETAAALFDTHLPEVGPVQLKGNFQGDREASNLTELMLTAGTENGVRLTVSGQLALLDLMGDSPIGPGAFELRLDAQPAGIKDFLPEQFATLSPVSLRANVTEQGGVLTADSIVLNAGRKQALQLSASGEIGQIPITDPLAMKGIATRWKVAADSTDPLLSLFVDTGEWDLGALQGEFRLNGALTGLQAEQVQISVGGPDSLMINVSGAVGPLSIRDEFKLKGVELDISATTSSIALLESVAGIDLPELGDISASARMTDADGTLGLEPLTLDAHKPDEISLQAEGAVDDLADIDEITLRAEIDVDDVSLVEVVADVEDPNPVPLDGSGVISLSQDKILEIQGDLELGSSKISLELHGEPTANRYQVAGDIRSPRIALADLGIAPTTTRKTSTNDKPSAEEQKAVFSDQSWSGTSFIPFDLSLNLVIDQLVGEELVLQDLLASVSLQRDLIAIEPFRFIYSGGEAEVNGRYSLEQAGSAGVPTPAMLAVNAEVRNLPIARIISQFDSTATREGQADLIVNLSATGTSPKALAASLDGKAGLAVENLRVLRRYLQLLAVDFLGWAISSSVQSDSYGRIDCSIFRLSAERGVLSLDELMMDGPELLLQGEGNIDLAQEQVNMVLLPKKKKHLFTSVTPVTIRGELANPDVSAIPYKAAAKEFGAFVVAPMIYVPVRALGYLFGAVSEDSESAEEHPCLKHTVQ